MRCGGSDACYCYGGVLDRPADNEAVRPRTLESVGFVGDWPLTFEGKVRLRSEDADGVLAGGHTTADSRVARTSTP